VELQDLTHRIIGCAITVHKELGPGFLKSIYEESLAIEFHKADLHFERQVILPVYYDRAKVGEHRLDFLVASTLVVELKAISELEDIHFAIARSYLKAARLKHGLLLNFASMPLTTKRVIFERPGHHS
jgi:GxxExxY protein